MATLLFCHPKRLSRIVGSLVPLVLVWAPLAALGWRAVGDLSGGSGGVGGVAWLALRVVFSSNGRPRLPGRLPGPLAGRARLAARLCRKVRRFAPGVARVSRPLRQSRWRSRSPRCGGALGAPDAAPEPVAWPPVPASSGEPVPPEAASPSVLPVPPVAPASSGVAASEKKSRVGLAIGIVAILVVVVAAAGGGVFYYMTRLSPKARYEEAMRFYKGDGVDRDYVRALAILISIGERGHAKAQYRLGRMYEAGYGMQANHATAALWYRKAADQGYAAAQYRLGVFCLEGTKGMRRDVAGGRAWLKKASAQGHREASERLRKQPASPPGKNGAWGKK